MSEESGNSQPNFQIPSALKKRIASMDIDPETGSKNDSIQHVDEQGNVAVERWVDRVAKKPQSNENEGR
jgi:hypothetical protein